MMRPRVLLDAAVALYAEGSEHHMRQPSRRVLQLAASGRLEAYASAEMIQEFVFHRLRRTDDPAAAESQARDLKRLLRILPFNDAVLDTSLRLVGSGQARGRDAVHAATALVAGISVIVSPDSDLDGITGLTRVPPPDIDTLLDESS
jgi:predicted nucleic acid-binding protein